MKVEKYSVEIKTDASKISEIKEIVEEIKEKYSFFTHYRFHKIGANKHVIVCVRGFDVPFFMMNDAVCDLSTALQSSGLNIVILKESVELKDGSDDSFNTLLEVVNKKMVEIVEQDCLLDDFVETKPRKRRYEHVTD